MPDVTIFSLLIWSRMAPPNGRHSASLSCGDSLLPVTPTTELQGLYDEWRGAEEQLGFGDRVARHVAQSPVDANTLLRPRTPSQTTTMSRSPSSASYTSTNLGGTDEIHTRESAHLDARRIRKAVRRGPLDKATKARAAFVRKLHACPECKRRKVSVRAHLYHYF